MTRRQLREERGQVMLMAALLATALLGLAGLMIDGGFAYAQRRQAQNAADHGAIAAARVVHSGGSVADAQQAALDYAVANGFEAANVTVNHPPASGPHAGDPMYIEVYVEEEPNTFFIHVLTDGSTVQARGVAGLTDVPADYALLVLDETACEAFSHEGTPDMEINDGSMIVNAECATDAFNKEGTGALTVDGDIDVYGGSEISGANPDPLPRKVGWQVDDPLAGTTPPERGTAMSCPQGGSTGTAANPDTCQLSGPFNRTLNPGTYYGGLDVDCVCTVTLNPGVYVMSGGGFTKAGGARIMGDGVMIYVTTNPNNPNGDGAPLPFDITGGGGLDLTPSEDPDDPYYGITLWQDEAITDDFYLAGNAGNFGGLIYGPGTRLDAAGISTALSNVQIITDRFRLRGTSSLTINYKEWRQTLKPEVFLVE